MSAGNERGWPFALGVLTHWKSMFEFSLARKYHESLPVVGAEIVPHLLGLAESK